MRRSLYAIAGIAILGLGVLAVGGAASADTPLGPIPLSGPAPDGPLPTLPAPLPSLPIPGPSSSSSPAPTDLPTGPAIKCPKKTGTTIQFCFTYGNDRTAWFWADQQYQDVSAGPANEQLTFPDPEAADTLPETVRQGDLNRVSAMYFDLIGHGVPLGRPVTKFVLKIQEGQTPTGPEQPEFNAAGQTVVACQATKIWAATTADVWSAKPTWNEDGCVKGTPDTSTPPVWTFDLTPLAKNWAKDPFAGNNGIVLVPQTSSDQFGGNYQVNFKIPSRDDSTTPAIDEYDSSKDRVVVDLTYAKAVKPHPSPSPTRTHSPTPAPSPTIPSGGGGGSTGGSSGGGTTCCSSGTGSTGGGGTGGTINGGSDLPPAGNTGGNNPAPAPQTAPASIPTVRFPWYVWVLLPVGLLALAAVRSILFERTTGLRPGGVIAAIRARNAAARGDGGSGGVLGRIRSIASAPTTRRPAGG